MQMRLLVGCLCAATLACTAVESPEPAEQVLSSGDPVSGASRDRYIVAFKKRDNIAAGKAALRNVGAEVVMDIHGMAASAVMLSADAVAAMRNDPNVEYVEVDAVRQPFSQSTPYGIPMVEADQVWSSTRGGGVKVCIIDSGLYTQHEDHVGTPYAVNGISGSNAWTTDGCGHGTHVAGTISALDNTAGVIGVNPDGTPLHIVKVFNDSCSWTYASGLADAVNKCVDAGAKVINMSLGGSTKSRTEENALKSAHKNGVLSVAAAGNDGNTRMSYPASYPIVISVAAVDSNKQRASFSQYNREVDLSAPGVAVNSTVPWLDESKVTVGTTTAMGTHIENSARGSATGALVHGGLCDSVGSWSGQVVLCDRGTISFYDKVNNVKAGGGVAAVIANNEPGGFSGTLGDGNSSTLVAIGISQEDGTTLKGMLGESATVSSTVSEPDSGYEAWDGTSMATPHVAGVAALIWSAKTSRTPDQIRTALEKTAEDLGAAGRDNEYGHGLIRARAALDYLNANYP